MVGQFRQFVDAQTYRTEAERDGKGGEGSTGGASERKPDSTWRNPGFPQTDRHPVVNASWNDAVAFCRWLSAKEGCTYRLPTEAEWEYACRAGSTTRYYYGGDASKLGEYAWFADNSGGKAQREPSSYGLSADGTTQPVGRKNSNAWGLYDLHGNVYEWCADWYDGDYYRNSSVDDPAGPAMGPDRVSRGGSWRVPAFYCRTAARGRGLPNYRSNDLGFRVALDVPEKAEPRKDAK